MIIDCTLTGTERNLRDKKAFKIFEIKIEEKSPTAGWVFGGDDISLNLPPAEFSCSSIYFNSVGMVFTGSDSISVEGPITFSCPVTFKDTVTYNGTVNDNGDVFYGKFA